MPLGHIMRPSASGHSQGPITPQGVVSWNVDIIDSNQFVWTAENISMVLKVACQMYLKLTRPRDTVTVFGAELFGYGGNHRIQAYNWSMRPGNVTMEEVGDYLVAFHLTAPTEGSTFSSTVGCTYRALRSLETRRRDLMAAIDAAAAAAGPAIVVFQNPVDGDMVVGTEGEGSAVTGAGPSR